MESTDRETLMKQAGKVAGTGRRGGIEVGNGAANGGFRMESTYRELQEVFYRTLARAQFPLVRLRLLDEALAEDLGLDPGFLRSERGKELLCGNEPFPGVKPYAQAYAGDQFGQFTMLGDGRARNLGEHRDKDGRLWDIQVKGGGETPFSRNGDGRATFGSMIREYLVSRAMYGLDIPTTRSLAVLTTGEGIWRNDVEWGAVLVRVAASHLRVGTFQYAALQKDGNALEQLALYAIRRHDPDLLAEAAGESVTEETDGLGKGGLYVLFFRRVLERQARLIAQWQGAAFIHGVMNTDNMTISGETIDYGPCAFMNAYNPGTVFSSIDRNGRYAYGNQPGMAYYNLCRLGDSLLPLISGDREEAVEALVAELRRFKPVYMEAWRSLFLQKIGFGPVEADVSADSETLLQELLSIMEREKLDFTNTFKDLTLLMLRGETSQEGEACVATEREASDGKRQCGVAQEEIPQCGVLQEWRSRWRKALADRGISSAQAGETMRQVNPCVIPRNTRVDEVIAAAESGDQQPLEDLLALLDDPYAYREEQLAEAAKKVDDRPYMTYCGT